MCPAPVTERFQSGRELSAALGQDIVIAKRPLLIGLLLKQARSHEPLEPVCNDVAGRTGRAGKSLKAGLAKQAIAQDKQRPSLSN